MSSQIDAAVRHHAMESGAFVVNATGWLTDEQRKEIAATEALQKYLTGGICTAIVAPYGLYLAGPLPEGEGMAVAVVDLKSITRAKNVLDTVGHYSRPDIFRLSVDRRPWKVLDEKPPGYDTVSKETTRPEGPVFQWDEQETEEEF
jgi:aliphatic nitrilase